MNEIEFKCDLCYGIFPRTMTDEESNTELKEVYGDSSDPDEAPLVCDKCYFMILEYKLARITWIFALLNHWVLIDFEEE